MSLPDNQIRCQLCGKLCSMQVPSSHLRAAHGITTKEYRALGYKTLSPARLHQLQHGHLVHGPVTRRYGKDHHNWKGGHLTGAGYKIIYVDGVRTLEHRHVAEVMLRRRLRKGEVVHHKDDNRSNNHPDNLEVMPRSEHDRLTNTTRWFKVINPETKEAAIVLVSHGWSASKTGRALRIDPRTVKRWLCP